MGYLKGRLKEELKGWLEGRLKGGLTSSKPLPPSLPCFKFFLPLHRPLSGGLGQVFVYVAGPNHIYKNLPRLCPFVPNLLKTASPERLLRPPLASSPASNFFFLYNAPSQEASGNSLYMWPKPPLASPLLHIFFPFIPSPRRRPQASLKAKQTPATYTKICPAYATPFVPTLPKTPSPKRLLRPPLPSSPASNSFSLYTAPSQEASGKSLYMWRGSLPRNAFEGPPLASPASNFFSLYTAPLRRPWAGLG